MAGNEGSGGFWTKADKDEREWYLSKLEAETTRLLQSESTAAHAIVNMLFGVNAGGAVAMLAYVSSDHAQMPHPYAVLIAFVVGLFTALVLAILGYYSTQTKLVRWIGGHYKFLLWRHQLANSLEYKGPNSLVARCRHPPSSWVAVSSCFLLWGGI